MKNAHQCPICSTRYSEAIFKKHGHAIYQCLNCTHRFAPLALQEDHASKIYGDHYFSGGADGYENYQAEATLIKEHGARYAKILEKHIPQPGIGRILDIGAAAGFILQGLSSKSWQGEGLEPNENMAKIGRQAGLTIHTGTLESYPESLRGTFQLITMIQVIAHFHDLKLALSNAAKLTRSDGYWLIETWNKDSLMARAFGQQWHEYSPPSVLHWFNPKNLRILCKKYGFIPIAAGQPEKYIKASHLKSLVRYKAGNWVKPFLFPLKDEWTLPYPSYDLFWLLLRKTN